MNFAFEIVLYESGPGGALYTFHRTNREQNELNRFLDDDEVRKNPDFSRLEQRLLDGIDQRHGYRRHWFRDEGPVQALFAPYPEDEAEQIETPYPPQLRLYCVRRIDLLIVGYGGVKTTRTYQEDDRLDQAVNELAYVDDRLRQRLDMNLVWFKRRGQRLGGDLEFERQDPRL